MVQSVVPHDVAAAMAMETPPEGTIADAVPSHSADDATNTQPVAPLGMPAANRPQPVSTGEELVRLPGLRRRQAMLGTKVPYRIVCRGVLSVQP
jgi:hypothetical protein